MVEVEDETRQRKEQRGDYHQGNLCLGLGVENMSRVLVLVFVNWNLYKKKNLFWFSSQVGEVLALVDSLYSVSLVSIWFMHW